MAFETISLGLTIQIPTSGTTNWAANLKTNGWEKISSHDHTGSGNGNKIGATALLNNAVAKAALTKNLAGHQNTLTSLSGSSPTASINWNDGNIQKVDFDTATGTVTFSLSNPIEGAAYIIIITNGASNPSITWPAAVLWPQGTDPILPDTDNAVSKIELYYDGTNYFGDWNRDYS